MSLAEVLTSVDGVLAQLFLNTEQLVQFGQSFRSTRSTSLDLTSAETNNEVSNGRVLGLTYRVVD